MKKVFVIVTMLVCAYFLMGLASAQTFSLTDQTQDINWTENCYRKEWTYRSNTVDWVYMATFPKMVECPQFGTGLFNQYQNQMLNWKQHVNTGTGSHLELNFELSHTYNMSAPEFSVSKWTLTKRYECAIQYRYFYKDFVYYDNGWKVITGDAWTITQMGYVVSAQQKYKINLQCEIVNDTIVYKDLKINNFVLPINKTASWRPNIYNVHFVSAHFQINGDKLGSNNAVRIYKQNSYYKIQ